MSLSNVCFRVSQITAVLMMLGWIAVFYTAAFLKGGHPPMSAYVGMVVIISSWVLGSLGSLCGFAAIGQKPRAGIRLLFLALNAFLLGCSVIVNFV